MFFALASLIACTHDFGLTTTGEDFAADDSASPDAAEDSAAPDAAEDSASADSGHLEEKDSADPDLPADDLPPEEDCLHTSDKVYVLSRDEARLYTFDPVTDEFTALGAVDCGTSQTPASMGVSRDGVAYIRTADDALYALNLETMRCAPTAYSDRATRFDSFGMGYATDSADTWRDKLYVANATSLGVLDPSTWTISPLGAMPSQSELTGNADGELWALFPLERVAELARLDKATGERVERLRLPDFPDPAGIDTFAFATWNGTFYLFIREYGMGRTTDVYAVDRQGGMRTVLTDVGFDVVGAGVSTCAPG